MGSQFSNSQIVTRPQGQGGVRWEVAIMGLLALDRTFVHVGQTLPTGYDWHGDAPLVSIDSHGFRPVVET